MTMILKLVILSATVSDISSAPKLGPLIFDPLIYESENSLKTQESPTPDLSNDSPIVKSAVPLLRSDNSNDNSNTKPCQSYDYDVTQCKYVNDRLICGYNKNKGDPVTDENEDVGNGCRTRNGRLECGYVIGPFVIPRRPPANDENKPEPKANLRTITIKTTRQELSTTSRKNNTETKPINDDVVLDNVDDIEVRTKRNLRNDSLSTANTNTMQSSTSDYITQKDTRETNEQPKKYCVEKNDNIFCYTTT